MRDRVVTLVTSALSDLNASWGNPDLATISEDTRLIGPGSALDSLALVSLIAEVETRVYDEFGKNIVIADEKAMSAKVSPFRSVRAFASHVEKLIQEA